MLAEACRQAAAWHAAHPDRLIDINVNLSGKQFSQDDLVEQVTAVLHHTGFPANHLILEITESVVMEHPEQTIKTLQQLKALGVKIHIDDFGTGYSSLAYLQRFPVDTMKIDRSFITRIGRKSGERRDRANDHRPGAQSQYECDGRKVLKRSAQLAHLASLNARAPRDISYLVRSTRMKRRTCYARECTVPRPRAAPTRRRCNFILILRLAGPHAGRGRPARETARRTRRLNLNAFPRPFPDCFSRPYHFRFWHL